MECLLLDDSFQHEFRHILDAHQGKISLLKALYLGNQVFSCVEFQTLLVPVLPHKQLCHANRLQKKVVQLTTLSQNRLNNYTYIDYTALTVARDTGYGSLHRHKGP